MVLTKQQYQHQEKLTSVSSGVAGAAAETYSEGRGAPRSAVLQIYRQERELCSCSLVL